MITKHQKTDFSQVILGHSFKNNKKFGENISNEFGNNFSTLTTSTVSVSCSVQTCRESEEVVCDIKLYRYRYGHGSSNKDLNGKCLGRGHGFRDIR